MATVHLCDEVWSARKDVTGWMLALPRQNLAHNLDQLATVLLRHMVIKAPQAASKFVPPLRSFQMAVSHVRWVWQACGVKQTKECLALTQQAA